MSREIPIIFSAEMVRAILDGRKTQTRRLAWQADPKHGFAAVEWPSPWQRVQPGDVLWVREAWKPHSIYADIRPGHVPVSRVFYAAQSGYAPKGRWRPAIHMPRWASRITLRVTATRIERLQEISEEDARAEGVEVIDMPLPCTLHDANARRVFRKVWNILHDKHPWESNPEVVAITFEREPPR